MDKPLTLWHERWSEGRIGFHRDVVNAHLKLHAEELLSDSTRVLVPLCGKSLDMVWLASRGIDVLGVELVQRAVQSFFEGQPEPPDREMVGGLERWKAGRITILQGDIFDVDKGHTGRVDAIYDRAAIIALPPDQQQRYASHLLHLLRPGGRLLLLTYDMPLPATQGPPFSVHPDQVPQLFSMAEHVERMSTTMLTPQTDPKLAKRGVEWAREVVWLIGKKPLE